MGYQKIVTLLWKGSVKKNIISMDVDVINLSSALNKVEHLANTCETQQIGAYVCVSNVHMCMEVFDSTDFAKVVNRADLTIPDGKPLSWAQKLLGYSDAEQVRGQDIMNALCLRSSELSNTNKGDKKLNIGLYGGSSDELLKQVVEKLTASYPEINITYTYSPPFRPLTEEEDIKVVKDINDANVNVLFVGIGCPKQERWMAEHKDSLHCVMLGVGAAYDFIAGSKNTRLFGYKK